MAYSELTLAEDGGGVSASADTPPPDFRIYQQLQ